MKKFVIGIAILIVFSIYSLGIRDKSPVIGRPSTIASTYAAPLSTTTSSRGRPASESSKSLAPLKDGNYTGNVADAYYGNVQVSATISSGKITDIKFLQYPDTHQTSVVINQQAMPYLIQEALQAQSSNVQIISGATFTSQAFQQSLKAALSQA
jgi:uncharacterized protein with FMN-binding domain